MGETGAWAGKGAVKVVRRTWLPATSDGISSFADGLGAGCVRAAIGGSPRMPGVVLAVLTLWPDLVLDMGHDLVPRK